MLSETTKSWQIYNLNAFSSFRTRLNKEHTAYLFQETLSLTRIYFSLALKISLGSDEENNHFFVSVIPDLLHPTPQLQEGLLAIDGVDQEDSRDPFVEGTNDSPKKLLACLNPPLYTVSQICSLTKMRSLIGIILLAYSTPTVTLYCSENWPFKKRIIRLLFPTHE